MKKLAVIIVLVLAGGGYFLYQKSGTQSVPPTSPNTNATSGNSITTNPASSVTTPTTSASLGSSTPSQAAGKIYKNGTYTGDTTDAFYGMMQVQLVMTGGKITDINFLQFPNKPGHTAEVSNEALPILKQEALQKQSAPVDIVSGATQTADAFNQSLASAIAKAQ